MNIKLLGATVGALSLVAGGTWGASALASPASHANKVVHVKAAKASKAKATKGPYGGKAKTSCSVSATPRRNKTTPSNVSYSWNVNVKGSPSAPPSGSFSFVLTSWNGGTLDSSSSSSGSGAKSLPKGRYWATVTYSTGSGSTYKSCHNRVPIHVG